MTSSLGKRLASLCAIALAINVLAGCTVDATAPDVSAEPTSSSVAENRLTAVATASPELQGFLDEWHKDGVTIAETPATDDEQLVAFTDDNGNGKLDELEPVLAQVPGEMSHIEQVAFTKLASGAVSGSCYTNSYEVHPGEYVHRGKTFVVTWDGVNIGFGSCSLSLRLSSEAFPGEEWAGFLKGTRSGVPFFDGWLTTLPKTTATIEIPWPTGQDILDDVYGKVGELSVASMPEDHDPDFFPEDRMIVGSWKSLVTSSN